MAKLIYTDGVKSVDVTDAGSLWDIIAQQTGATPQKEIMSRVAAASRAARIKSQAVSSMPFAVVDSAGEEVDNSGKWENVLGFMPNPRDLFRRLELSLMDNNGAYLRMGKTALKTPKQLHYVKYDTIRPVTNSATGELMYLDRYVNGRLEKRYAPDDNELIRFWLLDDSTELLPSAATETKSILSAAGILFYSDAFTENFYRRGGVKPTLIAMKGMVSRDKEEDIQNKWTNFLRGLGRGASNIAAKIFQAEAMDIKPFGDGLGDLKETPVYRQALENIAIGTGMPLSILLSNSANKATADIEYVQWFRNDIVPHFDFIADCLNEQVLIPLGYKIENRAESLDPEQEDEVSRVGALSGYGDALVKFPDADTFLSAAVGVFGYELPDEHIEAVTAYYAAKNKPVEVVPPPAPVAPVVEQDKPEPPAPIAEKPAPAKWIPNINEMNELRVWRDVALRRNKKSESMDFDYQPHYGGLPDYVMDGIKAALLQAQDADAIKAAFEIETVTPPASNDVMKLAEAMNKLAEAMNK